jgi:Tol biopolymer transport system component
MAKLLTMAIPILPGKEQEWAKWMHELKTIHYSEFVASRKRLGVRERVFLQHSPSGDVVIVLLKGDDPAAALSQFGVGEDVFTKWFADGVMKFHGYDIKQPPAGPLPELMIDSKA